MPSVPTGGPAGGPLPLDITLVPEGGPGGGVMTVPSHVTSGVPVAVTLKLGAIDPPVYNATKCTNGKDNSYVVMGAKHSPSRSTPPTITLL